MADAPLYVPLPPPDTSDPKALGEWAYREFTAIAQAMSDFNAIDLRPRFSSPTRPRDGMIAYADGTKWNPGSGAGHYGYIAGTWTKLFP